jgi:hypothetical protein
MTFLVSFFFLLLLHAEQKKCSRKTIYYLFYIHQILTLRFGFYRFLNLSCVLKNKPTKQTCTHIFSLGAVGASGENTQTGATFVIFGSNTIELDVGNSSLKLANLDGINGFVINGIDTGDYSSVSVSSAGDFNNDGYGDIVRIPYSPFISSFSLSLIVFVYLSLKKKKKKKKKHISKCNQSN